MKKVIIFVVPTLLLLATISNSTISSHTGYVSRSNHGELVIEPLDDARDVPQEKIDRLVAQLGSDDIEQRLAAKAALLRIGAPAKAALQKAVGSDDLEVSFAADSILRSLGKIRFIVQCRATDSSSLQGLILRVAVYSLSDDDDGESYYNLEYLPKKTYSLSMPQSGVVFLPAQMPESRYYIQLSIEGYEPIGGDTPRLQNMPVMLKAAFTPNVVAHGNDPAGKPNNSALTYTITGRVIDVKNGDAPVSGCNISAAYGLYDISDTDGTFKIEGAQVEKYLYVYKDGWRLSEIEWKQLADGNWEATVKMKEEKWFYGTLALTLLKPDGTPLANEQYRIYENRELAGEFDFWSYRYRYEQPAKTGTDGAVEVVRQIDSENKGILYVPGYVPIDLSDYKFVGGETVTPEKPLTLSLGRAMNVCVLDDTGKPVENALVALNHPGFRSIMVNCENLEELCGSEAEKMLDMHPRYYKTDAKGVVRITGLKEGQFNLRVFAVDHMPSDSTKVQIKADEKIAAQKITLTRACKVAVRVSDSCCNVSSILVTKSVDNEARDEIGGINYVVRDNNGYYGRSAHEHNYLKPGKHSFVVYATGHKSIGFCRELKAGDDVTEVVPLEKIRHGSIAGKIEFGCGIERKDIGEVHLGLVEGKDGLEPMRLRLEDDGAFAVKHVAEGRNYITVRHRDGRLLAFYAVDIAPEKISRIDIPVALARAKGVLCDTAGTPLARQPLKISRLPVLAREDLQEIPDSKGDGDSAERTFAKLTQTQSTNVKGEFAFSSLVPGTYLVFSDQTPLGRVVEIKPGDNVIDIKPERAIIKCKVTGAGERVKLNLLRVYRDPDDVGLLETSEISGKDIGAGYEVPPGDYIVAAMIDGVAFKRIARIAVSDSTPITDLQIAWPEEGSLRTLKGRVKNYQPPRIEDGEEYGKKAPKILISGPCRILVSIEADGTFEARLPAGQYKIAIPGRYLKADNAAQVAEIYEIAIDADKPATEVELPVEKPAPAPQPAPEKPQPAPTPAPDGDETPPAPQPAPEVVPDTPQERPAPEEQPDLVPAPENTPMPDDQPPPDVVPDQPETEPAPAPPEES